MRSPLRIDANDLPRHTDKIAIDDRDKITEITVPALVSFIGRPIVKAFEWTWKSCVPTQACMIGVARVNVVVIQDSKKHHL